MPPEQIASTSSPAVLLVNPEAAGGHGAEMLPMVQDYFASQGFPVEVIRTTSPEGLATRAQAAVDNGRRLLVAMGGDGTFQDLANAVAGVVAGQQVVLGIIPAGGGNDFAAAAGLPEDPVDAARVIVHGRPRAMDLLRARTADGRVRLYAGGGGIGLDADTARYASGPLRRFPGALRYTLGALWALRQFSPLEVTAEFPHGEHRPVRIRALLAAALNTPTYGAGLRLAPRALPDDGELDVVLVERLSTLEVLDVLPRLVQSEEVRMPQITRLRARGVRFSADRPAMFHGDGEIQGPAPVEIEVVPGAVRVLTGSAA